MEEQPKFHKWLEARSSFTTVGEYYQEDVIPNQSITSLLGIDKETLKSITTDLLEDLESNESFKILKQGYHSYMQFQDILNITIDSNVNPLENRHFCYYESLVYFRESVIAWIDGNVLAAITLLRPFLETSIMHLFWYIRCEDKGYDYYYDWLNGKKDKPPFRNQVDYVFDKIQNQTNIDVRKLKNRKNVILNIYNQLCSYNHTPRMNESIVGMSRSSESTYLDSFYFYLLTANILLRQIIYLYILVYPMSLFPVDWYQKWGFHGVKGIYFDVSNFNILKSYIGENNINLLKNELSKLEQIHTLQNWYNQFPDLTESEIDDDWKDFIKDKKLRDISSKGGRIAESKAYMRGLGWILNYINNISPDVLSDDLVNKLYTRLFDW